MRPTKRNQRTGVGHLDRLVTMVDPTDYTTWDLRELEERWASTRDAIEKAARRIDLSGMRRTRHPVEYAWLASRGRLGPF